MSVYIGHSLWLPCTGISTHPVYAYGIWYDVRFCGDSKRNPQNLQQKCAAYGLSHLAKPLTSLLILLVQCLLHQTVHPWLGYQGISYSCHRPQKHRICLSSHRFDARSSSLYWIGMGICYRHHCYLLIPFNSYDNCISCNAWWRKLVLQGALAINS